MATRDRYDRSEITREGKFFSETKAIIETAFFGNNVVKVTSLKEAYKMAQASPGTVTTDMNIHEPELLGLTEDSKVLVFNDGAVHGRCAEARRIAGQPEVDMKEISDLLKEAVYGLRHKTLYHGQCFIGLHESFMVKARLIVPEGHENLLYNWLLNFQMITTAYTKLYQQSKAFNESDIYVFSDPDWQHPDYPLGLVYFDPEYNCAAILGMRYFGEFKKGTLTLAWNIAGRHGYVPCHGGMKRYNLAGDDSYTMAFLGLSGSGKSTLTHATHGGKYDVSILHDDALVIDMENGSSVALEPSYFDKTSDYPLTSKDNKYLLSVQNCGITLDSEGRKVVVSEDIRNKNGRAIKSKLWSKNRLDFFERKTDAIVWLMKDRALPPVSKITDPVLAATMGALLTTKRTSAERLGSGGDFDRTVIEPYANPFRTYPLMEDYSKFKRLFEETGIDCYIFNTGHFMDCKVTKEVTLKGIEGIIRGEGEYLEADHIPGMAFMKMEGYTPDVYDEAYMDALVSGMRERVAFIEASKAMETDYNRLPKECEEGLLGLIDTMIRPYNPNISTHKTRCML